MTSNPSDSTPTPSPGLAESIATRIARGLPPEEKRYWCLVPVAGVASGLIAVGLQKLLLLVQDLARREPDALGPPAVVEVGRLLWALGPPLLCGVVVAVVMPFLRRRGEFHGIAGLKNALAFKSGRLPATRTFVEAVVSIGAVGVGASLGREGALIQSGAALSSWLGVRLKLKEHHVKVLLACGAAGGMAAAYNVPIGASVFAMEVLIGSFAIELFGPIIICSVISTTISRILTTELGDLGGLGGLPVYRIPQYEQVHEGEVLLVILLGVLLGCVSVLFVVLFSRLGGIVRWMRRVRLALPILAMLAMGALGLVYPALLGNGYGAVNAALQGEGGFTFGMLLLLPLLKILFTAVCRTAGIPGGLFTPSLFVGAFLGTAFGVVVNALLPGKVAEPGAYALVGMGAILAGTIQAPITAVLMIFEMTRDYGIILPLMSACIASALVSHVFGQGSLYTAPLALRGIRVPGATTPAWLRQPTVRTVTDPNATTISPAMRFEEVVETFLKAPEGQEEVYVVGKDGGFLGTVSLHEIKRFFRETQHLDSVIAADVLHQSVPFVCADDPLSHAILLLSESPIEHLPVLDSEASKRFLGTVSKRHLLSAYRSSQLATIDSESGTGRGLRGAS